MKIPLSRSEIGDEEIRAVTDVLQSRILAMGPRIPAYEQLFAETMGSRYAVAVNSGTSGLHLSVRAMGIRQGDEVITTPFSFIASANCILYEGAKPVFVDAETDTFGMDPDQIEAAITEKTKAILPVHVFGQCCKMGPILEIARKYDLKIIEDACESPMASWQSRNAGTMGDTGVFGFYPNKPITTGEGGMIITDNEEVYKLCKSMSNQGRSDNMQWLTHERLGYNYRISELTAALGEVQTRKLPGFIRRRRALARQYNELLQDIPGIILPSEAEGNEHAWFVYAIRVDAGIRDQVMTKLNAAGVQSKAYFFPAIHLQDLYRTEFGYKEGDFPQAEQLSREMIILPFFTQIREAEMMYVRDQLRGIMGSTNKEQEFRI